MTGSSTRFIQTVAKHSYFIFKVILKLILNFLEFSTFFYNILNEIKKKIKRFLKRPHHIIKSYLFKKQFFNNLIIQVNVLQ